MQTAANEIFCASARYHLHHLAHLFELFEQSVQLGQGASRTRRYTFTSRGIYYGGVGTLLCGHGVDHGLCVFEHVVVEVEILDGFAYPGYHAGQILEVAHLLDLGYLCEEVVEAELVLA